MYKKMKQGNIQYQANHTGQASLSTTPVFLLALRLLPCGA